MDAEESLDELLSNKELYEVFKSLWDYRKTFKQIQRQADIKRLYYNPNLSKVLRKLEMEHGLIYQVFTKKGNYYEISPVGKEINKLLSDAENFIN